MSIFDLIKKNKVKVLLACLVVLVVGLVASILWLEQAPQNKNITKSSSSLKNYDSLKAEFVSLGENSGIGETASYQRAMQHFTALENNSLSEKQKFDEIIKTIDFLMDLYSVTNNPKV